MTPPDSLTEAIARAIRATSMFDSASKYEEIGEIEADRLARAALSAIEQAGYVLMPMELTDEMIEAVMKSGFEGEDRHIRQDYAALLASRPRVEG